MDFEATPPLSIFASNDSTSVQSRGLTAQSHHHQQSKVESLKHASPTVKNEEEGDEETEGKEIDSAPILNPHLQQVETAAASRCFYSSDNPQSATASISETQLFSAAAAAADFRYLFNVGGGTGGGNGGVFDGGATYSNSGGYPDRNQPQQQLMHPHEMEFYDLAAAAALVSGASDSAASGASYSSGYYYESNYSAPGVYSTMYPPFESPPNHYAGIPQSTNGYALAAGASSEILSPTNSHFKKSQHLRCSGGSTHPHHFNKSSSLVAAQQLIINGAVSSYASASTSTTTTSTPATASFVSASYPFSHADPYGMMMMSNCGGGEGMNSSANLSGHLLGIC